MTQNYEELSITLDELEELHDGATPGIWVADIDDPESERPFWTGKFYVQNADGSNTTWDWDSPFIVQVANARSMAANHNALPALLEIVRAGKALGLAGPCSCFRPGHRESCGSCSVSDRLERALKRVK